MEPDHSLSPITNFVMGMIISLLTISIPFVIIVLPAIGNHDINSNERVS